MSNNRVLARSGFRFAYGLLAFVVVVSVALLLSWLYWTPTATPSGQPSTSKSTVTLSGSMSLAQAQSVFGGAPTPDQLVPGSQLSQALPPTSQCQWVGDSATWAAFLCSG